MLRVSDGHDGSPVDRLTERQRSCLRLVLRRHSSKEIARELGISSHTVDQRLKAAIQTLGVSNRFEAARLLAAQEPENIYQPLAYQPSDIAEPPRCEAVEHYVEAEKQCDDERLVLREDQTPYGSSALTTAGETAGRGIGRKLAIILAVAVCSALTFAGVLSGLEALSKLN